MYFLCYSAHVEKLDSDWTMNGKSILEGGAEAGVMSATYYAQRRISLSNHKRYYEPAATQDEGLHLFERTVESSTCFRKQLELSGQLSLEESRNLASLEQNMKAITPLIDGVIFLGTLYCTVQITVLTFLFRYEFRHHGEPH